MERHANSPSAELLQALLREAGIHGTPNSLSLLGISTCSVWALTVDGQQYVVRHRRDGDVQLAEKGVYLSQLLHRAGVPTAEVLALVDGEYGVATLSVFLQGIPLDRAIGHLSASDLHSAWYSAGEGLRQAHEITLPEAGEIVGAQVEPFSGGWHRWVLADLADDIHWLQTALNIPKVDPVRLEQVVSTAMDALADASVRLIHNDALPQNVLVAPGPHGWLCIGWLDWEFARAADPLWDLSTLDFRPAGLVPCSFYAGYGSQPAEPQVSIYELLMATWRTRAELEHGSHWHWPPQQTRIAYLHNLPMQVERLADLLDGLSLS